VVALAWEYLNALRTDHATSYSPSQPTSMTYKASPSQPSINEEAFATRSDQTLPTVEGNQNQNDELVPPTRPKPRDHQRKQPWPTQPQWTKYQTGGARSRINLKIKS